MLIAEMGEIHDRSLPRFSESLAGSRIIKTDSSRVALVALQVSGILCKLPCDSGMACRKAGMAFKQLQGVIEVNTSESRFSNL